MYSKTHKALWVLLKLAYSLYLLSYLVFLELTVDYKQ